MDSVDNERLKAELHRDKLKWRVRRRISITSFLMVILIGIFYMISPFILTLEQSNILMSFNSIIITIIGFNSSVVMFYIGAVTYSDSHGNNMTSK